MPLQKYVAPKDDYDFNKDEFEVAISEGQLAAENSDQEFEGIEDDDDLDPSELDNIEEGGEDEMMEEYGEEEQEEMSSTSEKPFKKRTVQNDSESDIEDDLDQDGKL